MRKTKTYDRLKELLCPHCYDLVRSTLPGTAVWIPKIESIPERNQEIEIFYVMLKKQGKKVSHIKNIIANKYQLTIRQVYNICNYDKKSI